VTTCSTASKTLSQEVRKASAVSFHDTFVANGLGRACRLGQCAFAVAPGNFFDSHNAATATVDEPYDVKKEDEKPPPFGELVVTGRRQMAARADCGRTLRGRTATSMLFLSALKWARSLAKPRKRWQRFRIVIRSMPLEASGGEPQPQIGRGRLARLPSR
jgi:hypothetical protein